MYLYEVVLGLQTYKCPKAISRSIMSALVFFDVFLFQGNHPGTIGFD